LLRCRQSQHEQARRAPVRQESMQSTVWSRLAGWSEKPEAAPSPAAGSQPLLPACVNLTLGSIRLKIAVLESQRKFQSTGLGCRVRICGS
jgi:hypothetical protein